MVMYTKDLAECRGLAGTTPGDAVVATLLSAMHLYSKVEKLYQAEKIGWLLCMTSDISKD